MILSLSHRATLAARLTSFIQTGLLIIVVVMPFHAFLSVSLGHAFGYQSLFQAWKEVLLALLAAAAILLLIFDRRSRERLRQPWVIAALGLAVLGLLVTAIARPPLIQVLFGIKTELGFIAAAIIAAIVADRDFLRHLVVALLIGAAGVVGFGCLQIFVLPPDFLTHFGYGPDTVVPYQRIAEGTNTLRFPSTLGGPNQLGTYLIVPLCLSIALFIRQRRPWQLALFVAAGICLIYTFSRGAWIGATIAVALTVLATIPARLRRPTAIISSLALIGCLAALPFALERGGPLQYYLLHSSVAERDAPHLSNGQHAQSVEDGAAAVITAPLGHGLGTAGPSTFYEGPINIIENYYLQIGYEMGLLAIALFGFILFTLVLVLTSRAAMAPLAIPIAASVIGVSVVAFVLPAWVDSTTALITWITAGGVAGLAGQERPERV